MKRWAISTLVLLLAVPSFAASRRRAAAPPPAPLVSACPHTVLAAPYYSSDITVDDSFAYFGDDSGGLFRVPKSGGSVTRLAQINDESVVGLIVLDGNTIYFTTGDESGLHGTIYSVPKSGGSAAALVTGVVTAYDMVVDASSVYWTSFGTPTPDGDIEADGKVERASKSGGNRQVLASGVSGPTSIVVDDTNVYYVEAGVGLGNTASGVRVVPKNGGPVTSLVDNVPAVALATIGNDIIFSVFDSAADMGTIARISKSGGTPSVIQQDDGLVSLTLRVFGDRIYSHGLSIFAEGLRSISLATGETKELVTAELDTIRFAVDDCAIYYVTFDDTVERTPR